MEIIRKEAPTNGDNVAPVERPAVDATDPSTLQPMHIPPAPEQPFDDGIRAIDPATGQPLRTELDELDLPPGNDWLRAGYQLCNWLAVTFLGLAKNTPSLTALDPELEKTIDQVCTVGYQVTNAGAELTRGLWSWSFSRVGINRQIEALIYPNESQMFDQYYVEWYHDLVEPVEAGAEEYDSKKVVAWVKARPEIADPRAFIQLTTARLRMDRAAAKSAWSPTDVFKVTNPRGERKTSTTNLHQVFRRRPG